MATALPHISNELHAADQSTWIVVVYLLTYDGETGDIRKCLFTAAHNMLINFELGFLLVFSKLADIFGEKSLLVLAEFMFLVFSMACGGAQNITQL